jgi:hypothetical protein
MITSWHIRIDSCPLATAETIFEVSLVEQKGHVKGLIRYEISKLTEVDDQLRDEEAATAAVKDE